MGGRISKDEYYLKIAEAIAERSTCLRRKYGAIVVKGDTIVSAGYNGSPRKVVNCDEVGCLKDLVNAPHGSGYDFCIGVHAEENAIINAARTGASVLGGVLYVFGKDVKTGRPCKATPCDRCKRVLINAGIERVVTMDEEGKIVETNVVDWVREQSEWYLSKLKEAEGRRKNLSG